MEDEWGQKRVLESKLEQLINKYGEIEQEKNQIKTRINELDSTFRSRPHNF